MNNDASIGSVMLRNPICIDIHERLAQARRIMTINKIHHLPVVDNDEIQGLITDRDINLVLDTTLGNWNVQDITVQDIMFEEPCVVDIDTPLIDVLNELAAHHTDSALITEGDKLVGIFSAADACRVLAALIRGQRLASRT